MAVDAPREWREEMGIDGAGAVMARRGLGPSIRGRIHCRDRVERQRDLRARRMHDLGRGGGGGGPSIRAIWWRNLPSEGVAGAGSGGDAAARTAAANAGRAGPARQICGSGEEEVDLPSARFGGATFHPRALLARGPGAMRPRGRRRGMRAELNLRGGFARAARQICGAYNTRNCSQRSLP
jgi:hypothetical protein